MIIAKDIKNKIDSTDCGVVMTIADFNVDMQYEATLVKILNRMVAVGTLKKISKGKYYKPKKTIFGELKPETTEIVKDFLEKDGNLIGYISGTSAFSQLGLTTQISSNIVVGTNTYRRPLKRGNIKVSFVLQKNEITTTNCKLLQILDAVRFFQKIPASTPDKTVEMLGNIISSLNINQQKELCRLACQYTSYVRALLGAIMENKGLPTYNLRKGLKGVTFYKLPISIETLPNKKDWNIL